MSRERECRACGGSIDERDTYCPLCGHRQPDSGGGIVNRDPFEPWNGMHRTDPFAPWNDPMKRRDPFAAWNNPFGQGSYRGEADRYR
jgi:hypothetical protein